MWWKPTNSPIPLASAEAHRELVTEIPVVEDGWILPPEGMGIGTELLPDLDRRKDAHVAVRRRQSLTCFRQQCSPSKLSGLTIERIERIGTGPSCRSHDHLVSEARSTAAVAFCRSDHIVGRLELKFFGSHKLLEDRRNAVSGESIGPVKHP